ncbi:MAG: IS630 family transposase [Gemmatimonadaceae bacterium]
MPLSRYSTRDLARLVVEQGITASISGTTVWRWLAHDAIRPWNFRSWIFPRDPEFAAKAGRVLDLYHHSWDGRPLRSDDYVLSADEKTSIQARARVHPSRPTGPESPMHVEHEYARAGALVYLAAWDVHRAKLFGRCEPTSGIAAFDALVAQVMARPPYAKAHRVFWIVDNGSSHRGAPAVERLARRWPNLVLVHLPIHASWLNQIEIVFSILQRKVLTPNAFESLFELEDSILAFEDRYTAIATPFDWKYNRQDLTRLLAQLTPAPRAPKIPA